MPCFLLAQLVRAEQGNSTFCWESNEERQRYMDENNISPLPAFPTGPPPAAPINLIPTVPSILLLVAAIVHSTDCLFFVLCKFGNNNAREWQLARVTFMDSISLYPLCTLDGRFLFKFYICHPTDWRYNAINQCYWLQLHSISNLASPRSTTETHLVQPTDTSDSYVAHHKLMLFRKWLNIRQLDTYSHGQFDFASICGRKTRDRIAQPDWDILHQHKLMFKNPVPRFNIPTYTVHCNRSTHMVFHDDAACNILLTKHSQTSDTKDIYGGP
jgi:hypothetical protein